MLTKPNIHEFRIVELFTDSKGRTSPGKVAGFTACIASTVVFSIASTYAIFHANENTVGVITIVTGQCVALFIAGGTLLGIRRFTQDKEVQQPL
jgi:hypothetical protein